MAEAKGIVKQQLQAMTEMKERVDKYGHLLSPEDQAFLSEQVALSLRKCKLYMDMEEAIQAAEKAKKKPDKKEEPVKTDETKEEKPKKKASAKKKKDTEPDQLFQSEPAADENAPEDTQSVDAAPVPESTVVDPIVLEEPEEKPAEAVEEPGAKTWEPMAEDDLGLDDLLG